MKAVILAGGKATRMGVLCKNIPKPLLELENKTFLDYSIELALELGLEPLVVLGANKEKIMKYLNEKWRDINYLIQENNTGDLMLSLIGAKDFIIEDFVFMGADTIFLEKKILKKLIKKYKGNKRFGLVYCQNSLFTPKIKVDSNGNILEFNVKGSSDSEISSPTFFISSKEFFDYINIGDNRDIVNMLIKDGFKVFGIKYPVDKVLEANTPEQYFSIIRRLN